MQISELLIKKFLDGRCTRTEADLVYRYFRKNPEAWKKYLAHIWDEETDQEELPDNYKEMMFLEIKRKLFHGRSGNGRRVSGRIGLRLAVAAASVALVFLGIRLARVKEAKQGKAALASVQNNFPVKRIPLQQPASEWSLNINRTDQKLKMKLEDGSVVTLLPHSSIRYDRHFTDNAEHKRDVYLQGQAFFDVARDKGRPFTVYAGNMATTVLGTSFSVLENETGVLVKLYSGKVMIHAYQPGLKTWTKDVYLKPGEQLKYEAGAEQATVTSFVPEKPLLQKAKVAVVDGDQSKMVFNNVALPDVIDKLTRHYQIPIIYDKTELSDMYFSGEVLETDSLSVILKVIANMNGLEITQTTDGFMVKSFKD